MLIHLFWETYSSVFLSVKCWNDLSGGTGGTSTESLKGETSHTQPHIKQCDRLISETWHTPERRTFYTLNTTTRAYYRNIWQYTKIVERKKEERKKERKKTSRMENWDGNANWQPLHLQSSPMCHSASVGEHRHRFWSTWRFVQLFLLEIVL